MAVARKPKLLYQITLERKRYVRRLFWSLLAAVAALGALAAVTTAQTRGTGDPSLMQAGAIIAIVVAVLFGLRVLMNLWLALRRRTETVRLFDKGFVWSRKSGDQQYGWSKISSFHEGGRGLYLGSRALLQWGAHRLEMDDGTVFRFTGAHGDLRQLGKLLRRPAAHFTGMTMGAMLRREHPVKLHRQLTAWPGGLEVGKVEIPWSEVDIRLQNGRINIFRQMPNGKFRKVRQFDVHSIENAGGFLDVAAATIRTHQRQRFEKERPVENTQAPASKAGRSGFSRGGV
jgi:hypothetical protein